jgi:hypothetical protein
LANINVTVIYDPSNGTWSITGDNVNGTTIEVNDKGANPIRWGIGLPQGGAGTINFDTSTGIDFTVDIPGDPPTGNANNWNWNLDNQLTPTSESIPYEYTVNAWYTPQQGATPQAKQWDPEVEENPPAQVVIKSK